MWPPGSHLRWGTFLPNVGTLGLWVLELFAMYVTDGQTVRQTEKRTDGKATLIALFFTAGGIISKYKQVKLWRGSVIPVFFSVVISTFPISLSLRLLSRIVVGRSSATFRNKTFLSVNASIRTTTTYKYISRKVK